MKKYILLFGFFALILMIPTAQATLANIVIDSTANVVDASEVIGGEIEVEIDIKPDTLSSNSKCNWVTCYITPSEGYTANDVDLMSITLTLGNLPALTQFCGITDIDGDGVCEAMVKFDRGALIALLDISADQVQLTITGMYNDGITFTGTDTIFLML